MEKVDLRVQRTKKVLKDNFKDMLLNMDYERITVKDLCEKSMINRRTFYLHYDSIDDLMKDVLNDMSLEFSEYTKDYDQDKVSYAVWNVIGKYVVVNFYYVDGYDYDSYQSILEKTDNGWTVLYEWEWYDISDEECERLNQHDNNLMDMFFLKTCPRG